MWSWKKDARPDGRVAAPTARGADPGRYGLLQKYLRERFANRVVLTFAEIEDLLGFALPEAARLEGEWWGSAQAPARGSAQSDAWRLASRTATVNLRAQIVVFER